MTPLDPGRRYKNLKTEFIQKIDYNHPNMMRRLFYELFYFRRPPWDTGISPPELIAFMDSHPPGRALDLGCGTGTNAITLAQHGWQVVGVDFVGRAVGLARRKAKRAGVQVDFRADDVTRLRGLTGPFDLVLDMGCLHSLTAQQKTAYINNLASLLDTQGTYLMYAFITQDEQASGTGLNPNDLSLLAQHLRLAQRVDGTDRGARASAWFTYQR
jgi:2-polyprenyl-3-methyl-5-hydroxy-6-metoxy-1,4-benzoquinol methylase